MEKIKFVSFNGDIMSACPICGSISVKERHTSSEMNGIEYWTFYPIKCSHPSFLYKKEPISKALENSSIAFIPEDEIK